MNIVFGLSADGRAFPDFPGPGNGVIGSAVVGPSGLLNLIEVQLGLTEPETTPVVRIAAWQKKMEAVTDGPFWAASFAKDPWATAQLVLAWRDGLVMAGWGRGERRPATGRLGHIAAAEEANPTLNRGLADRLWDAIEAIRDGGVTGLERLDLIEDRSLLPPGFSHLLDTLEASGVVVGQIRPEETGANLTDLDRVRQYLLNGSIEQLVGDGSFVEIEADTGLMAAESVAEWLAADSEPAGETVIIISDKDSSLLDRMLVQRGLPALGLSSPSPYRGALQVLVLAFAVAWRPLDPRKLMELLMLPRPPMRRWAANLLARALANEPGTGGAAWQRAWAKIEERLRDEAAESADERKVPQTLARWQEWTASGLFDTESGIPHADALAICRRVAQWALDVDAGNRNPLLLAVVGASRALGEAIETLGYRFLTPLLLERMIDQAVGDGTADPEAEAKAGTLRAVLNPGAIWGPVARIIWWDFVGPAERPSPSPWTSEEIAALEEAGCLPEPMNITANRIANAWQQAILNTKEQVIFVRPAHDAGAETITHPLAHRLDPLLQGQAPSFKIRAEQLLSQENVTVAARTIERRPIDVIALPEPTPVWSLPVSIEAKLSERRESATSLEDLVSCQLRWILQRIVRLSAGNLTEVPRSQRLFGNLAHELAKEIFADGLAPDPSHVRDAAAARLMDLVEAIAAPLLQPGISGELAFARNRIPDALAELARILREKGLSVVGTEVERDADFDDGLSVSSRLDMLVEDSKAHPRIIDLKWSRTGNYLRSQIKDGRAIQLATYSRLVDAHGSVPAGYYLLNQRQLVAETTSPIAVTPIDPLLDLDGTWDALVASWRAWRDLARTGTAVATGVEGAENHLPAEIGLEPEKDPCRFCDYRRLCRIGSLNQ